MKIKRIQIENFRSIKSADIDCVSYNSFVGPNGSGKSSVLAALNIFFGETTTFGEQDFYSRVCTAKISVTVTFHELSPEALEEFKHYARDGKLVVRLELESKDEVFTKRMRGERLVFTPFAAFFEGASAADRKVIFDQLRIECPGIVAATTNDAREKALRDFEEALSPDQKTLTPSGDDFFGVSKGAHKFQRHLHWVYVPAVKDATSEGQEARSSHLGKLIQHTVRASMNYAEELEKIRAAALAAYDELIGGQQTHLTGLEKRLSDRLKAAVMGDAGLTLNWKRDEKSISVLDPVAQVQLSDKGFSGSVENFGHGLQRAFLIIILQELMAVDIGVSPTLILGCEEPELYQHPPQARHLASILMELTAGQAQVFVTTHSPYFIEVEHYNGIKMFRNTAAGVSITSSDFSKILVEYNAAFKKKLTDEDQARAKLAIQLQPKFNELFFAERLVFVEGISDQACIEAYLRVSGRKPEFQKSGACIIVCEGKSSLALLLMIAKSFAIPHHVIFDLDANCAPVHQAEHVRDNDAIFTLIGMPAMGAMPTSHIFTGAVTAWLNQIEDVFESQLGPHIDAVRQAGRDAVGNISNAKKHPIYLSAATREAWAKGEVFPTFKSVVDQILS